MKSWSSPQHHCLCSLVVSEVLYTTYQKLVTIYSFSTEAYRSTMNTLHGMRKWRPLTSTLPGFVWMLWGYVTYNLRTHMFILKHVRHLSCCPASSVYSELQYRHHGNCVAQPLLSCSACASPRQIVLPFFSSSVFAERDFARSRLDVSGWVRQVRTFADSTTVYSSGIFTLALNIYVDLFKKKIYIYVDVLNPNAKKSDIFTVSRCRSINWLCCVLSWFLRTSD
jgi:hypothetical protein